MQAPPWYRPPLLLCGLGVAMLALPERWEGPLLIEISPGHALRLADAIGLIPLLIGFHWLEWGLWQRRIPLLKGEAPSTIAGLAFSVGLGLGLLLASAFSGFFWWWAIGAMLFAVAFGVLVWLSRP